MTQTTPDLNSYDTIIVAFSGGKDSLASVLDLLDRGVPREKIELWHHDVDGQTSELMDWPVTRDYCRAVAASLDIPIYFSWKEGGFEREMLRDEQRTAPIHFEVPGGEVLQVGGTRGKLGTRRKFPQVAADLSVRWCSAYLKIDVCTAAIRNQDRFFGKRTLLVTGERAEESPCRARYETFENDRADLRDGVKQQRHVDHWRNVHGWAEKSVWAIIAAWHINPHPAYRLGWGRVSCAACIFGSKDQWATLAAINPNQVTRISQYEGEFGLTINRKKSVADLVAEGTPYTSATDELAALALSKTYDDDIIVIDWELPAGAFGESAGPT